MASISDLIDVLGLSKSTITRYIKKLDPDGEHVIKGKRGALEIDEYLCSLISDQVGRDPELSKTVKETAAARKSGAKRKINGYRTVHAPDASKELRELYEKLAEVEDLRHQEAIEAKDREIRSLEDQNRKLSNDVDELKLRVRELEEKLETTRLRLDEMTTETLRNLSSQSLPWWKKLFGRPKKTEQ